MCINIHAYASIASAVIAATVSASSTTTTLDAWRAFLNAHAHVTRAISRDLADAGLPDLELVRPAVGALPRSPSGALRVNELAREVVLSPTAMSRFVDRVEAAGYVRREPDPDDRRALQVAITDEGVDAAAADVAGLRGAGSSATSPRSWAGRRRAVRAMLERMADSARDGGAA